MDSLNNGGKGWVSIVSNEVFSSGVITYLYVIGISLWGGLVSYLGKKDKFSWADLLAHLISASFAGMMTFFACDYAGLSGPVMGIASGVAGHLGTPAVIALALRLNVVRKLFEDKEKKDE